MSAEAIVYQLLSSDPRVTTLVSGRVYPTYPTQDSLLPYVTYSRGGTERPLHLGGFSALHRVEVRVDVWAEHFQQLQDVSDAVRGALEGYRDDSVQAIFEADESTVEEIDAYHTVHTFTVWLTPAPAPAI